MAFPCLADQHQQQHAQHAQQELFRQAEAQVHETASLSASPQRVQHEDLADRAGGAAMLGYGESFAVSEPVMNGVAAAEAAALAAEKPAG